MPKENIFFFGRQDIIKNQLSSRQPISKTNYLKTNLLKQIKNILSACKVKDFIKNLQTFELEKSVKLIYVNDEW